VLHTTPQLAKTPQKPKYTNLAPSLKTAKFTARLNRQV
jgi:hypothetical protein